MAKQAQRGTPATKRVRLAGNKSGSADGEEEPNPLSADEYPNEGQEAMPEEVDTTEEPESPPTDEGSETAELDSGGLTEEQAEALLDKTLTELAEGYNADIFLYSGIIDERSGDALRIAFAEIEEKRSNLVLILTTYGGSPEGAYKMVRAVREHYQGFFIHIFGACKSAGTLIALGADALIIGEFGELGPLDMQVPKPDELESASSLNIRQAIESVGKMCFNIFEYEFLETKRRSEGTVTTRTAMDIAARMAVGLCSPITDKIDPVQLAENERSLEIALQYGHRVCRNSAAVEHLVYKYPSHGFVIDFEEIKAVLSDRHVFRPQGQELLLQDLLFNLVVYPKKGTPLLRILRPNKQNNGDEHGSEASVATQARDSVAENQTGNRSGDDQAESADGD